MQRSTWPSRVYVPPPSPLVTRAVRAGVITRVDAAAPATTQPKGETAKPGKRAPTLAEREWMDWIVARGCIACRMDGLGVVEPCVHHILRGGRRMGHLHSLPLCPGHHQDGTGHQGLIARHPYKARFERRYGSEDHLLLTLQSEFAGRAK